MRTNSFVLLAVIGIMILSCSAKKNDPISGDEGKGKSGLTDKIRVSDFIGNYKLSWEDDFNGQEIDTKKWKYRAEGSKRQFATVSSKTITLDGKGNVMIATLKENDQYYVGQLATDGLFSQRYGYFECRAKMQQSLGTHSAFWLQTNTMGIETNDPANNGTEIDIFEYHRKTSNQIHHNLHWNGYGNGHKQAGVVNYSPFVGTDFHTFGLLWTDKEYIFFVDGVESWRSTQAISRIPQYMILSTELTGFGGDPNLGQYPDYVVFDYVKVYQLK